MRVRVRVCVMKFELISAYTHIHTHQSTLVKLLRIRKLRDNEELESLQLFKHMYMLWRSVQEWRKRKTDYMQTHGLHALRQKRGGVTVHTQDYSSDSSDDPSGSQLRVHTRQDDDKGFSSDSRSHSHSHSRAQQQQRGSAFSHRQRDPYPPPPSPPRASVSHNDDQDEDGGDMFSSAFNSKPAVQPPSSSARNRATEPDDTSGDLFSSAFSSGVDAKASSQPDKQNRPFSGRPRDLRPVQPASRVPRGARVPRSAHPEPQGTHTRAARDSPSRDRPSSQRSRASGSAPLPRLQGAQATSGNDDDDDGKQRDVYSSPPRKRGGSHRDNDRCVPVRV